MKKKCLLYVLGTVLCLSFLIGLTGCQDERKADSYEEMRATLTEQGIFAPEESKLPFTPVTWGVTWGDETTKGRATGFFITGTEAYGETEINYSLMADPSMDPKEESWVYDLILETPAEGEDCDWVYDLVVWHAVSRRENGDLLCNVTFYHGQHRYQLQATFSEGEIPYDYKDSAAAPVLDYLMVKMMDSPAEMLYEDGVVDYDYLDLPPGMTRWTEQGFGPVGVVRGDKVYRLWRTEFFGIVYHDRDLDKLLANRDHWFGPNSKDSAYRLAPVPLSENATTQGTTETFVCNEFDHKLELQISNVREIKRVTTDYGATYDLYVVYPGAMAAVINADMHFATNMDAEEGFLAPDWSFYYHRGPRFAIWDGMDPVPITEELCGIIDEGFVPIQFEVYQGEAVE